MTTHLNKQDLVELMATQADISKSAAETALNIFVSTVTSTLSKGGKISIVGFGGFEVSDRQARKGRNPQTGEEINIPAARVPKFKAGKGLKDAVNH